MTMVLDGVEVTALYAVAPSGAAKLVPVSVDASGRLTLAAGSTSLPQVARLMDGTTTTLGSILALPASTDGRATGANNGLVAETYPSLFNGTTFDRQREAAAAVLANQSGLGAALVAPPGRWSVISTPAAGSQASASQAAGGAGVRHNYASSTLSFGATAAPAATLLQANVRDGASGAGTVIDAGQAAVPAAAFASIVLPLSGKSRIGTAATAMTAEFSASLASLAEGASIEGWDAS